MKLICKGGGGGRKTVLRACFATYGTFGNRKREQKKRQACWAANGWLAMSVLAHESSGRPRAELRTRYEYVQRPCWTMMRFLQHRRVAGTRVFTTGRLMLQVNGACLVHHRLPTIIEYVDKHKQQQLRMLQLCDFSVGVKRLTPPHPPAPFPRGRAFASRFSCGNSFGRRAYR